MIGVQNYIIYIYQPVEARIIKSYKKQSSLREHVYIPKIEYQYSVNGKAYKRSRIYTVSFFDRTTEKDANQLIGKYYKGSTHTAYYNPHSPAKAVLIKECQFLPYGVFFVGHFAGWLFGLVFLPRSSRPFKLDRPAKPRDRGDGWFDLVGISEKIGEMRMLFGAGFLYMGITFLMWVHYNYLCSEHGIGPDIGTIIFAAPGLIPIVYGILSWRQRLAKLPILAVSTNPVFFDNGFSIWVYWPVSAATHIHSFTVGLVKEKITKKNTRWNPIRHRYNMKNIFTNTTCQVGEDIVQEIDFHIPHSGLPKKDSKGKPLWRYRWHIEVEVQADRRKDRIFYPLPVTFANKDENA